MRKVESTHFPTISTPTKLIIMITSVVRKGSHQRTKYCSKLNDIRIKSCN